MSSSYTKTAIIKKQKRQNPQGCFSTPFILNCLDLPQGDIQTAVEKHFSQSQQSLEASIPIGSNLLMNGSLASY